MSFPAFLPSSERQDLMLKGITQLEAWLFDLVRVGLLQYDFSETSIHEISSRLVDAKLGGIARRVRRIPGLNRSDPHWFYEILSLLGELYLLVSAFKQQERLSENLLTSMYTIAGYNLQKSDFTSLPAIDDRWLICGIVYEEEENLRARYCWIMGSQSKRTALLLDFAFGRNKFDPPLDFNRSYQGKLIYYPGSFALRAQLMQPVSIPKIRTFPAAFDGISKFLDVYALAISKNPWIHDFPACLKNIRLLKSGDRFLLQDPENMQLPAQNESADIWPVFASLALQSCTVFGIWNGRQIRLLSIQEEAGHYPV